MSKRDAEYEERGRKLRELLAEIQQRAGGTAFSVVRLKGGDRTSNVLDVTLDTDPPMVVKRSRLRALEHRGWIQSTGHMDYEIVEEEEDDG